MADQSESEDGILDLWPTKFLRRRIKDCESWNKELIKLAGLDNYSFVDADGDVPVPPTKRKGKKGKVLVTQEEATKLDDAVELSDVSTVIAMPAEAVAEFLRRTDDESDSESDLELDSSPEVSDSDADDF